MGPAPATHRVVMAGLKESVNMEKKQEATEVKPEQQEDAGPRLKVRRTGLRLRSRVRAGAPDIDV